MKKCVLLLSIGMLFSTVAVAGNDKEVISEQEEKIEACKLVSSMARRAMLDRQSNKSKSIIDSLAYVDDFVNRQRDEYGSEVLTVREKKYLKMLREAYKDIMVDAYEYSYYESIKNKKRVIEEFENNNFIKCYKGE